MGPPLSLSTTPPRPTKTTSSSSHNLTPVSRPSLVCFYLDELWLLPVLLCQNILTNYQVKLWHGIYTISSSHSNRSQNFPQFAGIVATRTNAALSFVRNVTKSSQSRTKANAPTFTYLTYLRNSILS